MQPNELTANWSFPTQIRFGVGRIAELPEACRELGMSRPLLVTDPGLAALDMIREAVAANEAAGLPTAVFSDFTPNPVGSNLEAGVRVFREGGHDGVVAFGGGSALDMGKGIAFMAGQTRPVWDFEDIGDNWRRADPDGIAPVVAVPTTAGTGSEVGRAAVFINEETVTKVVVFHPRMLPGIVIEDPALSVGLPPHLTAATGMDALAHNLEAYCVPSFHPLADGIAVEGMRLIRDWLPVAVEDGANLVARGQMLAAASMGATAFQKGLGGIHAISHPTGARFDTHHGLTNAVVMPYVLSHNRPAIEEKMARLARWLDLEDASFGGVLDWIMELRRRLQIPHTLAELGVDRAAIPDLAAHAERDPTNGGNPVPMTAADYVPLLEKAFDGVLD